MMDWVLTLCLDLLALGKGEEGGKEVVAVLGHDGRGEWRKRGDERR